MLDAASSRIGQSPAATTNKEERKLFIICLAKDRFLEDLYKPLISNIYSGSF
jgi:hypothetical protein